MPDRPIVRNRLPHADPAERIKAGKTFGWQFSHDEELPLKVRVKRNGWFGRKISVTTTELVWLKNYTTYIEVPAGFVYDLASIPRIAWAIVAPLELALESLAHDLLYRKQEVTRLEADQTLLNLMIARGVPCSVRWAVYLSVRLFGWKAWNQRSAEMEIAQSAAERIARDLGEVVETPSAIAPDSKVENSEPD